MNGEQLSLGELMPEQPHGLWTVHDVAGGREAECLCGWRSETMPFTYAVEWAIARHIARTPQGERLVRTLSKRGRGSHDA